MDSVNLMKENLDWTEKVDQYFSADPYKLDLALSQCHEYVNKAALTYGSDHIGNYITVWNEI